MAEPITAEDLLATPWRLHEEQPGVILADLGETHRCPWLAVVDEGRDLSDADAASIAAHIVALHNAAIVRREQRP